MQEKQGSTLHWVVCDRSGFKVRSDHTVMEWNGLRSDRRFADVTRHPQDSLRPAAENVTVPNPRPEPTDTFLSSAVTVDDL